MSNALINCIEAPLSNVRGQVFNLGSNDQNYQIIDLGKKIQEIIPEADIELTDVEDKRNYNVSFDKIQSILNFQSTKTITDTVHEIKKCFDNGSITDYKQEIYNNHKFLKSNSK